MSLMQGLMRLPSLSMEMAKKITAKVSSLIPTAWYPSGVYTNGNKIMVLNAKGLGAGPNAQHQYIGNMMQGTMSFIDVPDQKQLKTYTEQVKQNDPMR